MAAGAAELVSCTVVALSSSGNTSQVDSHTFLKLFVPAASLTICPSTCVQAVDTASLIDSIITTGCLLEADQIPSLLFTLLMTPESYHQTRLSTTRIPIFDERMGNPAYGFRGLGLLSTFIPPLFAPQSTITSIDHQDDWPLTEVIASKRLWISLGVQLPTHFILIVSWDSPRASTYSLASSSRQRSSSIHPSVSLSRSNSPPDSMWDENTFNMFASHFGEFAFFSIRAAIDLWNQISHNPSQALRILLLRSLGPATNQSHSPPPLLPFSCPPSPMNTIFACGWCPVCPFQRF